MLKQTKSTFSLIVNYKYAAELIFTILFLFSYLPHFIYVWMPQVLTDTFAYMFITKDIMEGNLPLVGHRMDVPYGLSLFQSIIFELGGSVRTIILVQTVLFFSTFIYLITSIKKVVGKWTLIISVLLWLYASSSQSLLWNSLLYTESIYISNLVVITGLFIRYFLDRKVKYIYLLSIGVLLGMLIRTNGMYLVFIPGVLLIDRFYTKEKGYKHIFFASFIVLFISCSLNLYVKGSFRPGEWDRIMGRLDGKRELYKFDLTTEKGRIDKEKWEAEFAYKEGDPINTVNPWEQSFKLFTHVSSTKFGNHYYYRMPRQIYNFTPDGMRHTITHQHEIIRNKTTSDPLDDHVNFILQNLEVPESEMAEMKSVTDIEKRPRNLWLLANHALELAMPLHRNWVVVLLFYMALIWNITKMIKLKKIDFYDSSYLVIILSLIHLLSLLFLSISGVSNNALPRYAIVSEFIIYILIGLFLMEIYHWLKNNSSKKLIE